MRTAYEEWFWLSGLKDADDLVSSYLKLKMQTGWLKRARLARWRSMAFVAGRLKITPQTYAKFERHEQRISLAKLREIAEALDCELVYALRPKSHRVFSVDTWERLDQALRRLRPNFATWNRGAGAVSPTRS